MKDQQKDIEDIQSSKHTRMRSLGSTEHLFWLLDQNRPTHFAMVAEVDRSFPPQAWHAAFRSVQRRHPLLSTFIGVDAQGNTGFHGATDATVPLRVIEREPDTWRREVAREIATPFDWSVAPLWRATLLQGAHASTLILVVHHSVLDGMGSAYLIQDLLLALSGEALAPLGLVESLETLLESQMNSAAVLPAAAPALSPRSFRPGAEDVPQIDALAFPAEFTRRLIARARAEQTTVHGAIAAAVHEAGRRLSREWRSRPLRTVTPVDVRHLASEVGTSSGVYITQTITVDDHPPGAPLWIAARKIKRDLVPAQTPTQAAAELKALDAAMSVKPSVQHAASFLSTVLAFDVLLSNLGNQPVASAYGDITLEALWGPFVTSGFADDQVIGVCTTGGVLRLTHTSYAAIPGLLSEIRTIIEAAVNA
ncbi:condensation domain-containing protein [Caballeronia sordidicola]|uniref:Phthiocerol/phthiodiolone dimycocerosyl transferase n=1 Tax=Caballeronia sordidicola TaxID=196367 RepID=A0A158H6K9_CABSO|nr:condensation domain-containing protein [Caballeronia sordidicola]SAL39623.1 condensation domain-containing protein [Caballeronia sordidicola]